MVRPGASRVEKVFAVETTRSVSVRIVFVMTSPFWHYREVTLAWLLMVNFQPIKIVNV